MSMNRNDGLGSIEDAVAMSTPAQLRDPDAYLYNVGAHNGPADDEVDTGTYRYRVGTALDLLIRDF